jgi:hypothetical protein
MKNILLLLTLFIAVEVQAAPYINKKRVEVRQIHIVNPWMPERVSKRMAREGVAFLRKHKIRAVFMSQHVQGDRFSQQRLNPINTTGRFLEEFLALYSAYGRGLKRGVSTMVTAPPWELGCVIVNSFPKNCTPWMAGWAYTGSVIGIGSIKGGFGYHTAMEFSSKGTSSYRRSLVIFIHELLHTLGANHIDNSANVMNVDAQGEFAKIGASTLLPILPQSIEEIKRTLSKL